MKRITCGNYQFRYEENKDINIRKLTKSPRRVNKPIICTNLDTGQIVKFKSSYLFAQYINSKSNAHILEVLNGKRNHTKRWKVEYDS